MIVRCPTRQLLLFQARNGRTSSCSDVELAISISSLCITRPFSWSARKSVTPQFSKADQSPAARAKATSSTDVATSPFLSDYTMAKPKELRKTPAQLAAERAKATMKQQQEAVERQAGKQGALAENSLFAEDEVVEEDSGDTATVGSGNRTFSLAQRNPGHLERALVPRPTARQRWQRNMVIRQVRRGGRLTKEMKIMRTERHHLAKSHFFKTSMKKLAPLARQIAGKSLDEAILQMRFSKKKAARDVRAHLMQARNEAIVVRGMGLRPQVSTTKDDTTVDEGTLTHSHMAADPSIEPRTPLLNAGWVLSQETDMYIAQAWVNRGPYGRELEYRARGRVNLLRPPHTGLSILLKEEKTRTREKMEKEAKAIRKRLGKNMWTQLPDRPVMRQSQYVLW